ncbi:MAG: hypothetical protein ABIQ16_25650 [Polyangiaceae bacterium]
MLEPTVASSCVEESLRCSYGDSRTAQCRHLYQCTKGAWQADTSTSARYSCDALPADYCPAEPHDAQACTIATVGMPCAYGELSCVCYARAPAPGKPGNWLCYGPPANPDCPGLVPNLGWGCNSKGLACNYDGDACGAAPSSSLVLLRRRLGTRRGLQLRHLGSTYPGDLCRCIEPYPRRRSPLRERSEELNALRTRSGLRALAGTAPSN